MILAVADFLVVVAAAAAAAAVFVVAVVVATAGSAVGFDSTQASLPQHNWSQHAH